MATLVKLLTILFGGLLTISGLSIFSFYLQPRTHGPDGSGVQFGLALVLLGIFLLAAVYYRAID